MAELERPKLYFHFDPPDARPSQASIVFALKDCTKFKLNTSGGDSHDPPIFESVEFESVEKARKAYALVRGFQLLKEPVPCSVSLFINEDASQDKVPKHDVKPLIVSELPPDCTTSALYDIFIEYGSIHSCRMEGRGVARIEYYQLADAEKACKERHYSSIETYQISVRFASKYDKKDSFKNPRPFGNTALGPGASMRRVVSEKPFTLAHERPQLQHAASAGMTRSVSQPVKIIDPARLIVTNIPDDFPNVHALFNAFATFGSLREANLSLSTFTGVRHGILVFDKAEDAARAMQEMQGKTLQGFEGEVPLQIRQFEPKGKVESKLEEVEKTDVTKSSLTATAAPFVPSNIKSATGLPVAAGSAPTSPTALEDVSFASARSHIADDSGVSIESPSVSSSEESKHRRLLQVAISDSGEPKAAALAEILLKLPKEEVKRCIFEDAYLRKKVQVAKELYLGGEGREGGDGHNPRAMLASPSLEQRASLLSIDRAGSKGSSQSSDSSGGRILAKSDGQKAIVHSHRSLDSNPWQDASAAADPSSSTRGPNEVPLDALVRFSVMGIMDLARSSSPPSLLAKRDKEVVERTDAFFDGIKGLKSSQQKQKVGEKVFKMLKAKAPGLKNLSKKTVTLLDDEDLESLLHLCEEFPDVLAAKAQAMP